MLDTNGWGISPAGANGGSTLDITSHIQAASGRSLPTNRLWMTRRFFSQFDFVSLTGSLHLLPFFLLAIEQCRWATYTKWTWFLAKSYAWSSGRQISWNGRHLRSEVWGSHAKATPLYGANQYYKRAKQQEQNFTNSTLPFHFGPVIIWQFIVHNLNYIFYNI